jgi:hypothetical protein
VRAALSPRGAILTQLLHYSSDVSLLLSREQERGAGLARNDYFSLWQPEGYADLAVPTTANNRLASRVTLLACRPGPAHSVRARRLIR